MIGHENQSYNINQLLPIISTVQVLFIQVMSTYLLKNTSIWGFFGPKTGVFMALIFQMNLVLPKPLIYLKLYILYNCSRYFEGFNPVRG